MVAAAAGDFVTDREREIERELEPAERDGDEDAVDVRDTAGDGDGLAADSNNVTLPVRPP